MDWGVNLMVEKAWDQEQLTAVVAGAGSSCLSHGPNQDTESMRADVGLGCHPQGLSPTNPFFSPTRLHLLKVPQHLRKELLVGSHHEPVRTFYIQTITMCRGDCLKPE